MDGRGMRWSYVINVKAPPGEGMQMEHVEIGVSSLGETIGAPQTIPFREIVAGNSVLRFPTDTTWGWAESTTPFGGTSSLPTATADYRFVGRRGSGERVTIPIRIRLDRSVGIPAATAEVPDPLPPNRSVDDLVALVGMWRGYVRDDGGVFNVPLEIRIQPAGFADVALNSPITRRFRGHVLVTEGRVRYGAGSDSGTLTLHERETERILVGYITSPRQGAQTPLGYTVRLRWAGP
jgi:hypothetical protein